MKTLNIDSGIKRIQVKVDDGEHHVVSFNPSDALFASKLHALYFEAKAKVIEISELEKTALDPERDENNMPLDISGPLHQVTDLNDWFRLKIDGLLGDGTSKAIYGDTIFTGERVEVYLDLIGGIAEVVEPVRSAQVAKYVKK